MNDFQRGEYAQHVEFFRGLEGIRTGHQGHEVMLLPADTHANFNPKFAAAIDSFFSYSNNDGAQKIVWHTRANHGASSQACCVNFLFPMAQEKELLAKWVDHVMGISGSSVQPIDHRCGKEWYVTFEWFPATDYLNENSASGKRARGSNSTSVDAALRYEHQGRNCLLMIEWKYTESYASTRSEKQREGDQTRERRYRNLWKRPHGPIEASAKVELTEFFLDPWYQLLRQQMLAYHCETDPLGEFDRVTLLHVSPEANMELKKAKGPLSRFGENVYDAFASLIHPAFRDRFLPVDTAWAFSVFDDEDHDWREWARIRYPSICNRQGA